MYLRRLFIATDVCFLNANSQLHHISAFTIQNSINMTTKSDNRAAEPKLARIYDIATLKSSLEKYHPVLIEGPGNADDRDATPISHHIIQDLKTELRKKKITKPVLLIGQGDPLKTGANKNSGIAAISQIVSNDLGVPKGLVCLDEYIYDWHAKDADRHNVKYEMRYSQMVQIIKEHDAKIVEKIEKEIDNRRIELNKMRKEEGKDDEMKDWFSAFGLLQEMTKVAMKLISGDVTVVHTKPKSEINKYSITAAYEIGLKHGFIGVDNMLFCEEDTKVSGEE